MPELHYLHSFNRRDGAQLYTRNPAAIAIAGNSLCDAVRVNGRVLSVGQVMDLRGANPLIEPYRSFRTGADATIRGVEINHVALETFARGEVARAAPARNEVLVEYNESDSTTASHRIIRLPFQGRRMAQMSIGVDEDMGVAITWTVYGIRYRPRRLITAANFDQTPHYVTLGTGSVDRTFGPDGVDMNGSFSYAGGTDSAERFDELELWIAYGSAVTYLIRAQMAAWGENGGAP